MRIGLFNVLFILMVCLSLSLSLSLHLCCLSVSLPLSFSVHVCVCVRVSKKFSKTIFLLRFVPVFFVVVVFVQNVRLDAMMIVYWFFFFRCPVILPSACLSHHGAVLHQWWVLSTFTLTGNVHVLLPMRLLFVSAGLLPFFFSDFIMKGLWLKYFFKYKRRRKK